MATQLQTTDDTQRANVPALSPQRERYAILKDQAKMFAMSPLIPDSLRGKTFEEGIANCLIAIQMAEKMGEMPLVVMQNIHIVKGKAGFAAQYMIARANASGVFKGRIGWRVEGKGEDLSVTAFATLADTGEEVSFTCDMAMARAEQWTSNPKYKTMPEVMLRYRSATFLVRFYAPDVMLGYQTTEEVEDVIAAAKPVATPLTAAMIEHQATPAGEVVDAEPVTDPTEGPADTDRGEAVTLASAKAEVDAATTAPDVNSRVSALAPHLNDDEATELREYGVARIEALKGAKG